MAKNKVFLFLEEKVSFPWAKTNLNIFASSVKGQNYEA